MERKKWEILPQRYSLSPLLATETDRNITTYGARKGENVSETDVTVQFLAQEMADAVLALS